MLENSYTWRDGSRFRVSADIAAQEMEKCTDESGYIVPQLVVNRARLSDSPIHPEFEWDDAAAAEEHRRYTARVMAGCLIMTVKCEPAEPITVNAEVVKEPVVQTRALVHISRNESSGYRWADEVHQDKSDHQYLLEHARRDAQTFTMKYGTLKEVSAIIAAIEATPNIL
ncbi:hypothetical protein AGMMS49992_32420 [Clostridia bacterium]|nr:hypothetical protein AGMMS49992_32420 [Clostridia bacterium]